MWERREQLDDETTDADADDLIENLFWEWWDEVPFTLWSGTKTNAVLQEKNGKDRSEENMCLFQSQDERKTDWMDFILGKFTIFNPLSPLDYIWWDRQEEENWRIDWEWLNEEMERGKGKYQEYWVVVMVQLQAIYMPYPWITPINSRASPSSHPVIEV